MMEKRNVVEDRRTPAHEITRKDEDWDKQAAAQFKPSRQPAKPVKLNKQVKADE